MMQVPQPKAWHSAHEPCIWHMGYGLINIRAGMEISLDCQSNPSLFNENYEAVYFLQYL